MRYSSHRRTLLVAGLAAAALAGSRGAMGYGATIPAAPRLPVLSGSYLQLLDEHRQWSHADWVRLFEQFRRLQISRLVVQWVSIDEQNFYLANRESGTSSLQEILALADRDGMRVMVGLHHDAAFWTNITGSPEAVSAYLGGREARAANLAGELVPVLRGHRSFLGWYLPDEIDDTSWSDPAVVSVLHSYLHRLSGYLRLTSPSALIGISGFSNGRANADEVRRFWDALLRAAPAIGLVIFQDGIGVHKLTLDTLAPYAAAVQTATRSNHREFWSVVELFEQTAGRPLDSSAFHAVAASFTRVRRQLHIESAFTADLIAFTASDYLYDSDPQARRLLESYLHYLGND